MARETKQERVVRSIYDQVSEHLHEIKGLAASPSTKEIDVERWCQSVLKNCLGYTATNGYSITAQEVRGKMKPDLIVFKDNKPVFIVEVKKLGFDLNKSDFRSGKIQLSEYLKMIGDVKYGILSNGYEWKLFDFSDPSIGGVEALSFDVRSDNDEFDLSKKGIEETAWEFLDFHEATYNSKAWAEYAKEATAFSPESLAKAILGIDVVKVIAKEIRGEYEYKANAEVLLDRIFNLLENGLDDTVPGWNEVKQLELQKFVKSQKRAGRKKKVRAKEAQAVPTANAEHQPAAATPQVSEDAPSKTDAA